MKFFFVRDSRNFCSCSGAVDYLRHECRECFVMICECFAKCVHWSRWFFDKLKEIFSPYFQLLHTFAKTVVYDD